MLHRLSVLLTLLCGHRPCVSSLRPAAHKCASFRTRGAGSSDWCALWQELVLDVEYMLAVLSPKTEQELPHDDWCGLLSLERHELDATRTAPVAEQLRCAAGSAAWMVGTATASCQVHTTASCASGQVLSPLPPTHDVPRGLCYAVPCVLTATAPSGNRMSVQGRRPLAGSRRTADGSPRSRGFRRRRAPSCS